jgi:hypothetical protein
VAARKSVGTPARDLTQAGVRHSVRLREARMRCAHVSATQAMFDQAVLGQSLWVLYGQAARSISTG